MKLSEFKTHLSGISELNFQLADGKLIPKHFHVTEVGQFEKHFIDCGGMVRREKTVCFQLWYAGDVDHRLQPKKLIEIIDLSEKVLKIEDAEIEVEYQNDTIGKYGLAISGNTFVLTPKHTACLAEDQCGIPFQKQKVKLSDFQNKSNSCCSPDSKCC